MKVKLTADLATSLPPGEYSDLAAPGLTLRVSPAGARVFAVRYRVRGRANPRRYVLEASNLADARRQAAEAQLKVRAGVDPLEEAEERRRRDKLSSNTLEALCRRFLEERTDIRPATRAQWTSILRAELAPALGKRDPLALTRPEVRAWSRAIARSGRGPWANRCHEFLRRVFSWAVAEDLLPANTIADLPRPYAGEQARDRVLSDDEIKALWRGLDSVASRADFPDALRLVFWTLTRRSEAFGITFGELDLRAGTWVIPAERSKSLRSRTVPLCSQAVELLERRQEALGVRARFVFPVRGGGAIHDPKCYLAELRRVAAVADFRPHDVRRTGATFLGEAGVAPHVIGAVLGHTLPGPAVTRIYDRAVRIGEMRAAIERWAAHLEAVTAVKERSA